MIHQRKPFPIRNTDIIAPNINRLSKVEDIPKAYRDSLLMHFKAMFTGVVDYYLWPHRNYFYNEELHDDDETFEHLKIIKNVLIPKYCCHDDHDDIQRFYVEEGYITKPPPSAYFILNDQLTVLSECFSRRGVLYGVSWLDDVIVPSALELQKELESFIIEHKEACEMLPRLPFIDKYLTRHSDMSAAL